MEFFQSGGAPMWAILVLGLLDIGVAASFARGTQRHLLPVIAALGCAVLFSVAAGTLADLAAVGTKIPNTPQWATSPRIHLLILEGVAESMAPGILGFSILSIVSLECAVGLRRMRATGA
jgi:hypothetical protein